MLVFLLFLLMSYCSFLSLILSSINMISFYIFSKRFSLKPKVYSDAAIALTTKKIWFCSTFFIMIDKVFKDNIWLTIKYNLLKFLFVWNYRSKIVHRVWSNIFWDSKIRLCIKKWEMFGVLPLINNSFAIVLIFFYY